MEDVLNQILKYLEELNTKKGVPKDDSLVDKNIIKSDGSTFGEPKTVSAVLKPNERRKLTEVFTLFTKVFYEQKAKYEDAKPKTLVSEIKQKQETPKPQQKEEKCKGWGSVLALLVGGVALVAAAVPTIIASLFQKIGPLGDALKILGKTGLLTGLKLLTKTVAKAFALPILKRLPIIGSLINFYFAYKEFKANRIAAGVLELIGGILNFVPGVGTILSIGVDILKAFLDSKGMFDEGGSLSNKNAVGTILGWGKAIGKWIWDNALWIPIIGGVKRLGMAYDAFSAGSYGEGIKQVVLGIASFIPLAGPLITGAEMLLGFLTGKKDEPKDVKASGSWVDGIKKWIISKLDVLPWWMKRPLEWFGILPEGSSGEQTGMVASALDGAKKGFDGTKKFIGNIWDKVKGPMGDSVDAVKGFAINTWEKTKEFSANAWDTVTEQAPKIWESIKSASASAWEKSKEIGSSMMSGIKDMASKAQDFVAEWAPSVLLTIKSVTDKAMEVLSSIAKTIGNWISNLFSSEDEKKLEAVSVDAPAKQSYLSDAGVDILRSVLKNTTTQAGWLRTLHDLSKEQIQLLSSILNVETMSLQELKRMSGNSGSSSPILINHQSPQPTRSELLPVGNNRSGYTNSPYSLSQ